MMKIVAGVVLAAAAVAPMGAEACDRPMSPFEDPVIGVAAADLVAVVEVSAVGAGAASVKVLSVLKGKGVEVAPGRSLKVKGVLPAESGPARMGCGVAAGTVGQKYVALLWLPPAGASEYALVDPVGGWRARTAEVQASFEKALAQRHPASPWSAEGSGVRARLVPAIAREKGEVDLLVVWRNVSKAPVELAYKSWPEAEQSTCVLTLEHAATMKRVEAREVPIARKDIVDYFPKHGRAFTAKLEPGEGFLWLLSRVTTAAAGWGYKEELGFRYYPVTEHGPHRVGAECRGFFGPRSTTVMEAVELAL